MTKIKICHRWLDGSKSASPTQENFIFYPLLLFIKQWRSLLISKTLGQQLRWCWWLKSIKDHYYTSIRIQNWRNSSQLRKKGSKFFFPCMTVWLLCSNISNNRTFSIYSPLPNLLSRNLLHSQNRRQWNLKTSNFL